MGNNQGKPGPFEEGTRAQKRSQIQDYLKSKAFSSIYPPPDSQVIKTRCRAPIRPALQKVIRMILNAQPAKEENETIVTAHDGRIQVYNTARWPYGVHGVILCKFRGLEYYGTGTLIGPNIVLTAGHNLYDHRRSTYTDLISLQFLPGVNGQLLPFVAIEVEKYYVSPNYIKEDNEDYGILILKKPIGDLTGYFRLAYLEPEEIKSKRIGVTGYPGDKFTGKQKTWEMWGMEGRVADIDQDRGYINYLIDTGPGQSGAGVWYQERENYYVCGVHMRGDHLVNTATLMTRASYEQIYKWLNQDPNSKLLFALDSIEKLEFDGFQLDTDHLEFLAQERLEGLTTLNFFSQKIRSQGAKILSQNTSWSNLSMLDLFNNQIGPEGCQALAQNLSWINLSWLNLNRNNIGSEGAAALAQNASWINLSRLLFENNNIAPEGALALAQNTSWTKLECLSLASNCLGVEGAKTLSRNTSWVNLQSFNLEENEIDSEEEKELVREAMRQIYAEVILFL